MEGIDRRAHPRVEVALRCYDPSGNVRTPIARTVNLSRRGALLTWNEPVAGGSPPKVGDVLRLDVLLPPSGLGQKCIRCRGRVVRVDDPLIAIEIEQMEFRSYKPVTAAASASSVQAAEG